MSVQEDAKVDAFADAFLHLPRGKGQRRALQRLTDILSHQQIRDLQSMIDEVDLRCDPLTKLPVEILGMISQHLPLYQVFQAQRVSRSWRSIFSSPRFLDGLLRSCHPELDDALYIPDDLPTEAVSSLKAEHIDAFQSGAAFGMKIHDFERARRQFPPRMRAYASGFFAWVDDSQDHRTCKLLDLGTGEETSYVNEERAAVQELAVSSSMIAATSATGKCFVWTFHDKRSISLQMPSARVNHLILSGQTLAVGFFPESLQQGRRLEVITWTLNCQKTHSFFLDMHLACPDPWSDHNLILDKAGESILLVESLQGDNARLHMHSTRASLTGSILVQNVFESSQVGNVEDYLPEHNPVQAGFFATIRSIITQHTAKHIRVERTRYDFSQDRLEIDSHVVQFPGSCQDITRQFFWEDVAYIWMETSQQDHEVKVIDLKQSKCVNANHMPTMSWSTIFMDNERGSVIDNCIARCPIIFGDGIFHIRLGTDGLMVWCFDKNVQMQGGFQFDRKLILQDLRATSFGRALNT